MRRRRPLGPACLAVLVTSAAPCWALALPAAAEATDGTLTVVVSRDVNTNGDYDPETDEPQAGIEVTVTDAGGKWVTGTTDDAGEVIVEPTEALTGGRYFVTATIPPSLELGPVPESASFSAFSFTADVTSESQTVHLGVRAQPRPDAPSPTPKPELVDAPGDSPPAATRFAVGDRVWKDLNRDGRQDVGEPAAPRTSVQLLDQQGSVLRSTTTDVQGHYRFDELPAGVYSLRFAGIPAGYKLSPAGVGAEEGDSDPDYRGATPGFELSPAAPEVRRATEADDVRADYIDDSRDAGIARLTFGVASVVWQDLDGDGLLDPDEPAGQARVSLLDEVGRELSSTTTDGQGRFGFGHLAAGVYYLRFKDLGEHRKLTRAGVGNNAAVSSSPDPRDQTTEPFTLDESVSDLVPADEFGDLDADLVKATLNAGTVASYGIADRVWRDTNGNGVADPDEPGVGGVRVELLDGQNTVVATTVTARDGGYAFEGLPAGAYRLHFPRLPKGLFFTAPVVGGDRNADSDVYGDGLTAPVTVDQGNPAVRGLAAGLSTSPTAAAGKPAPSSPAVENPGSPSGSPAGPAPASPVMSRPADPTAGSVLSPAAPASGLTAGQDGAAGQRLVLASVGIGLLALAGGVVGVLRLVRRR
ncbi:MAG: SdrD B-like domain-containing protein [Friedmanniella sp.]